MAILRFGMSGKQDDMNEHIPRQVVGGFFLVYARRFDSQCFLCYDEVSKGGIAYEINI